MLPRSSFAHAAQLAAPWLLAALLMHHAIHYAWLAEDAFINFRVIANVLDHQGLTWNPGERVQVYTSPLWMALSVAATALQGDPIPASVWLSFTVFAIAVVTLWLASGRRTWLWVLATVAWCSSRSVRDYICCGLETPLVMAMVGVAVTWPSLRADGRARHIGTLLALAILVRHDLALLLGPLLLHEAWLRCRAWPRLARELLIGLWPLIAWSAWAWLYYGSPVPNTALAKIVQGWNGPHQAWYYHGFMQHFDPWLLSLMIIAMGLSWVCRGRLLWPAAMGLALFAVYLTLIGGDYMAGRFMLGPLTLSLFVAVRSVDAWLAQPELSTWHPSPASAWTLRARQVATWAPLLAFGTATCYPEDLWPHLMPTELLHDVVDARQGLWGVSDLNTLSTQGVPRTSVFRGNGEAITQAEHARTDAEPVVYLSCAIGMTGYFAPRHVRIVDPLALGDRFLAGLPVVRTHAAHIGHFERPVPAQYVASLLSGTNAFTDPAVAAYHDDVQRVLHDPLWEPARLAAIWRLSTGAYRARLASWQDSDGGGALPLQRTASAQSGQASSCLGSTTRVTQARLVDGQVRLALLPLPTP